MTERPTRPASRRGHAAARARRYVATASASLATVLVGVMALGSRPAHDVGHASPGVAPVSPVPAAPAPASPAASPAPASPAPDTANTVAPRATVPFDPGPPPSVVTRDTTPVTTSNGS